MAARYLCNALAVAMFIASGLYIVASTKPPAIIYFANNPPNPVCSSAGVGHGTDVDNPVLSVGVAKPGGAGVGRDRLFRPFCGLH